MSDSNPENNAQSRFAARVMIVISLMVFVISVSLVLWFSSSVEKVADNMVEDGRAAGRMEKLADVVDAQQKLMTEAVVIDQAKNLVRIPVKDGMKLVLPVLKSKKEGATKVLVPGSPTQLKQSQATAAAAKTKDKDGAKDAKAPEKKDSAETKVKAPAKK